MPRETIKLPGAPMPVMEAGGRGFRADFRDVIAAQAPAQINARGFVAQAGAAGAIGQGLQDLGGQMGRIAAAELEAINTRRIAEAEMAADTAEADLAAELASNADKPETWGKLAEKKWTEVSSAILTKDLSPAVRDEITLRLEKKRVAALNQVKVSAVRQQFAMTGSTLEAARLRAIENKDWAGAAEATKAQAPYINPDALARREIENREMQRADGQRTDDLIAKTIIATEGTAGVAKADQIYRESPHWSKEEKNAKTAGNAHEAEVQNLMVLSYDDPFRAAELAQVAESERKIMAPDRIKIMEASESRVQELRATKLKAHEQDIRMGRLPDPVEMQNDPYLTDDDRASIALYATQGPVNDPLAYASLYAEAANFKGDPSSPEYAVLSQRASLALSGDLQSKVMSKLDEVTKAKNPDALTRSQNEVFSMAADDLKAGRFGPLDGLLSDIKTELPPKVRAEVDVLKKSLLTDDEKAKIQKEPSRADYVERKARDLWWSQQPKGSRGESFDAYVIDNETAKSVASRRYQDALMNLEKWKQDNPKATPQELRAQYDRYLVRQKAGGAVPLTGDLPPMSTGGMPAENPLFDQAIKALNYAPASRN